jgi:hypothetical protein
MSDFDLYKLAKRVDAAVAHQTACNDEVVDLWGKRDAGAEVADQLTRARAFGRRASDRLAAAKDAWRAEWILQGRPLD